MAMQTFPEARIPKEILDPAIRYLTVSCAGSSLENDRVPALVLKGKWLEKAGFPVGTVVDVWVRYGCLVLTARKVPEEELDKLDRLDSPHELEVQELMTTA